MKDQFYDDGKQLPVMEEFYSIQGEGAQTGKAAYFIRLGGCDVGCNWCDVKESWDSGLHPMLKTDDVVSRILQCPAKAVVVTGGEPLLYDLTYLCRLLKKEGIKRYLETSGSETLKGEWDWICLSPKKNSPPDPLIFPYINELKVVIRTSDDFLWAEENATHCSPDCILSLQPEWSSRNEILPVIIDYILANPVWKTSLQAHKYMRIP